jgi:hypothetical protein
MYPSEINSNRSRNLGASIAMVTNWLFVYVVVSITPVGRSRYGSVGVLLLVDTFHRDSKPHLEILHNICRPQSLLDSYYLAILRRDSRAFTRRD